jgi:hypothetical protein
MNTAIGEKGRLSLQSESKVADKTDPFQPLFDVLADMQERDLPRIAGVVLAMCLANLPIPFTPMGPASVQTKASPSVRLAFDFARRLQVFSAFCTLQLLPLGSRMWLVSELVPVPHPHFFA